MIEDNGPGESKLGAKVYGLGLTVSGSVVNGAIGTVETEDGIDTVNPHCNWAIQQWESDSWRATYDGVPGRLFYGGKATHPDGPRSRYGAVENQAFVYSDFPGAFKQNDPGNLTYFEGDGYSALTAAAERNVSIDTVRYLLKAGADRNFKTVRGERPYDIAMRYHNRTLARLLKL